MTHCVAHASRSVTSICTAAIALILAVGCNQQGQSESTSSTTRENVQSRGAATVLQEIDTAQSQPITPDTWSSDNWRHVLASVVSAEGLVRYRAFDDPELLVSLQSAVADFANAQPPAEPDVDNRKALLINAFNANAMLMAAVEQARADFESVKDVPGFFTERTIMVARESFTLDSLRNRLRSLGDPRIHAALVCAARGSPPLRATPYSPRGIERELDEQARTWIDDMRYTRATQEGLWLSKIFEEYAEDFDAAPYNGVLGFIRKHARPNSVVRDYIRGVDQVRIRYQPFNWQLNVAENS